MVQGSFTRQIRGIETLAIGIDFTRSNVGVIPLGVFMVSVLGCGTCGTTLVVRDRLQGGAGSSRQNLSLENSSVGCLTDQSSGDPAYYYYLNKKRVVAPQP
ncbi:hypothetical protein Pmani_024905 [Petrolisthes manimaculis]|uniref:Uncharacterized protein n=1 Tax=Petrolisthes manimaculis TaxID=1843537 RepID=A0AAE1P937_9EUCA|nr:hypothetical protein Pmani_024905 [Petrolisthes manimaculis]